MSSTTTGQQKNDRDYAWHRHPALLAGIPAVAAVGGAVLTVVLGQAGALPQAINPAPPTTTVTVVRTTTATSTDSPSGSPVAGGARTPVWKENVNLPVGDGLDIDQPVPVVSQDTGVYEVQGFDLTGGVPYVSLGISATAGTIEPGTPATYDGCLAALSTNAERDRFAAAKGTVFCVRSGLSENPHVALFQVQQLNASTNKAELEVTVWSIS